MKGVRMMIQPLGDRVVVKPNSSETKSKGGIVLPDTAKEKPQEGEVVAVGKGKVVDGNLQPLELKKGDKVVFSRYGGDEFKIDDIEYKILREDEVLGVIVK